MAPKLVRVGRRAAAGHWGQNDAAGMVIDQQRKNGLVGRGRPAAAAFGADGAAALYRRETLRDCAMDGREVLGEDMALWASDADGRPQFRNRYVMMLKNDTVSVLLRERHLLTGYVDALALRGGALRRWRLVQGRRKRAAPSGLCVPA